MITGLFFTIFIYLIFMLFIISLLILFCPVNYKIDYNYQKQEKLNYKVRLNSRLFLIFLEQKRQYKFYQIKIMGIKIKNNKKLINSNQEISDENDNLKKRDKSDQDSGLGSRFIWDNLSFENIKYVMNFLKDLAQSLRPKSGKIEFLVGFQDPYYNGILLAWYYSIKSGFSNFPVILNIVWEKEVIKSTGNIKGYIIIGGLIWRIISFLLRWRVVIFLIKMWKQKKS